MFHIDFKGRVSKGIRLFIIYTAFVSSSFGVEPTTAEGRTNRNAFPLIRYQNRYAPVPAEIETSLRAKIEQVLAPVRLLQKEWFRTTFQVQPLSGELPRSLSAFSEIEIWKCSGEYCQGCPGGEPLGCILGAKTPTGFGVVALIHPCLYGVGKCTKRGDIDGWAERFIVNTFYFKLGLAESPQPRKVFQERSTQWIRKTSDAVNEALSACPGPYSRKTLAFLRENQAVSPPNSAIKSCGERYLMALRKLADQCGVLKTELKDSWNSFSKTLFDVLPEVLRGNSFSRSLFCRRNDATTLFTLVGKQPTLILFDEACEGENPKSLDGFLRGVLPPELKNRMTTANCLSQAAKPNREAPGISELGNGQEIQLVE